MKPNIIKLVAAALAAALIVPAALALVPRLEPAPALGTIALGETELKGGTTKGPDVSDGAIDTIGPDGKGKLKNSSPLIFDDMTCEVENGSAGAFKCNGKTAQFGANGRAHVDFDPGQDVSGGNSVDYEVTGMEVGDGEEGGIPSIVEKLTLHFTPSAKATVSGIQVHTNPTPAYRLSAITDSMRSGVERADHPYIAAWVVNDDAARDITGFSGSVGFPGQFQANLIGVYPQTLSGQPLANASVSILGDDFTISGFSGRDPGSIVLIVAELDVSPAGDPVQIEVTATFAP